MKLSVLMSIYNETIKEIVESIESVRNQTLDDFEFIIVNDNPDRREVDDLLKKYKDIDKRIVVIKNEKNIGLANSMNRAATIARADIYVRMDADDISESNRFKIQYEAIKSGSYDLVFSNYSYIDENSREIYTKKTNTDYYSPNEIRKIIPYKSVIHHPTVMMTKDIFERTGGYRDFPCAQDRDLWLRMWEKGAQFYMVNEELLKYRIRRNSVSRLKIYQQKITLDYIQKLFLERLSRGQDTYSYENYNEYINKKGVNDVKKIQRMHYYTDLLSKAKIFEREKKYIKRAILRIKVFVFSPDYRRSYINQIRSRIIIKVYKNNIRKLT